MQFDATSATPRAMPPMRTTRPPSERREIPTRFMMQAMREALPPAEVDARAFAEGYKRSNELARHMLLIQGYDGLISGGFVTRSDVYFSAPEESREMVA